jgi:hypothetical protein
MSRGSEGFRRRAATSSEPRAGLQVAAGSLTPFNYHKGEVIGLRHTLSEAFDGV